MSWEPWRVLSRRGTCAELGCGGLALDAAQRAGRGVRSGGRAGMQVRGDTGVDGLGTGQAVRSQSLGVARSEAHCVG